MNNVALLLVVISAFFHATWNLLAKRTNGGATTVWQYDIASTIIYAPLAIVLLFVYHVQIAIIGLVFICGSACLHLSYFILLQCGYRVGDLSFVYPLARGIGPFLATILAITVFGERPPSLPLSVCCWSLAASSCWLAACALFVGYVTMGHFSML